MKTTTRKLPSFDGVGYGQVATSKLDTGMTYEELFICSNVPPSYIKSVSVKLNGSELIHLSGVDLFTIEKEKKRFISQSAPWYYIVPFAELVNLTYEDRIISALKTFGTDLLNLHIEFEDFDEDDEDLPSQIQLKAHASVSANLAGPRVLLPVKKFMHLTAHTTKDNELYLDRGPYYQRLHFGAELGNVKIVKDDKVIWERDLALNAHILERMERAPQDGMYTVDFIESDHGIQDALDTSDVQHSLKVVFDAPQAGTIRMIAEYLQPVAETPSLVA